MRADSACRLASGEGFQVVPEIVPAHGPLPAVGRAVHLDPASGEVIVQFAPSVRRGYVPQSDGKPTLRGGRIIETHAGGHVVAVLVRAHQQMILFPFVNQQRSPIDSITLPSDVTSFRLSRDGRFLAHVAGDRRLHVRDVGGGPISRFVTPVGKSHPMLDVALGSSFLTVKTGKKHAHAIAWFNGVLWMARGEEGDPTDLLIRSFGTKPLITVAATSRSRTTALGRRIVAECSAFGLTVLVDIFGQIAILDQSHRLICMFFVFRDQVAAWLPDGTRHGPVSIIGGPPTPNALGRIGAALMRATGRVQEATPRREQPG